MTQVIGVLRHPLVRTLRAPDTRRTRWAFAAMAGRGLLGLGVPFFFGRTVGLIGEGAERREVLIGVAALLMTALATGFCQFWMRWLYIGASRDFELRLKNHVFAHLTTLGNDYFDRARTGDLMSRLTADVEAVRMGVGPGVMHLIQTSLMATGALAIMTSVSWNLTVLALLPLAIIFWNIKSTMRPMHAASSRVQDQIAAISALAQESFSGARVIKAFAREDYEIERFQNESNRYIEDTMNMTMIRARMHGVTELMAGLVVVTLLYFGGKKVVEGSLNIGAFVSFFGYFMMLVWPMIAIGWTLALLERSRAAMTRLDKVLDTKPSIISGDVSDVPVKGSWALRDLNFRYDAEGPLVLEGIDIAVPAGTSLAIVGPTGSGKSTIVRLMARLYEAPTGSITLDDRSIDDFDLDLLRRSISSVPQETFLFSDTIRANIAYAHPEADDETVRKAAEIAQVLEAIESFPRGLEEVVGERGVTLSGGQKQRVAIARALLHEAPTLILDDCLSAVDTKTEEKILDGLSKAMQGRTTIIVAHRLSSVMHCDQIIVLDQGRIVERGRHEELVQTKGWYADTYRRQQISEELDAA